MAFSANNREVPIEDPMEQVVKRFARLMRSRDPVLVSQEHDDVRLRLQWYRRILDSLE
jgi:hypothetical protein